jgi:calmodulin
VDEERLLLAFETLDIDNTGYLDTNSICRALGDDISKEDVEEMVKEVDENLDGKISYKEFLK